MLSVHAVKSVGVALDLMESVGLVAPGAPQVPKPAGYRGDFPLVLWFRVSSLRAPSNAAAIFPSILACFPPSAAARMCSKSLKKNCCLKATCRPPRRGNSTLGEVRALLEASLEHMAELRRCRLDSLKGKWRLTVVLFSRDNQACCGAAGIKSSLVSAALSIYSV